MDASEADAMPLPSEDTTPPVTKIRGVMERPLPESGILHGDEKATKDGRSGIDKKIVIPGPAAVSSRTAPGTQCVSRYKIKVARFRIAAQPAPEGLLIRGSVRNDEDPWLPAMPLLASADDQPKF